MAHVSRSLARVGGPNSTGMASAGVKLTSPVRGLITVMLNTRPAQLVIASPTPVALIWKAAGSAVPPAQLGAKLEHDGVRVIVSSTMLPTASAPWELLMMTRLAGRPVSPTVTVVGQPGPADKATADTWDLAASIDRNGEATTATTAATIVSARNRPPRPRFPYPLRTPMPCTPSQAGSSLSPHGSR